MSLSSRLSASRGAKTALAAVVIVAVLIFSTVGAFLLVTQGGAEKTVTNGSVIKVNYVGKLPDGRVFDTSLYDAAVDNTTYPKSLFFAMRGGESTYKPLDVTVGKTSLITGFTKGLMGMKLGETKTLVIPVSEAYGNMDASKLKTVSLNETVPVQKTMTKAEFKAYYGSDPLTRTEYVDPNYGWKSYVSLYDGTNAYVQNLVPLGGADFKVHGSSSDPSYGWTVNATVSGSTITVHHLLTSASALHVKGYDGTTKMFVESVDEASGTFVLNKNSEVVGRTLTFVVTVVSIA